MLLYKVYRDLNVQKQLNRGKELSDCYFFQRTVFDVYIKGIGHL